MVSRAFWLWDPTSIRGGLTWRTAHTPAQNGQRRDADHHRLCAPLLGRRHPGLHPGLPVRPRREQPELNFFTKLPTPVGETGGGMANAIVGSAKLLLLAMAVGVPIGFLGGVYLAEFGGATFSFIDPLCDGPAERRPVHRHRHLRLYHRSSCRKSISRRWPAAWPWAS